MDLIEWLCADVVSNDSALQVYRQVVVVAIVEKSERGLRPRDEAGQVNPRVMTQRAIVLLSVSHEMA